MKVGDLVTIATEPGEVGLNHVGVIRELDYAKSGYVRVYWKHVDSDGLYNRKYLVIVKTPADIIKDIV